MTLNELPQEIQDKLVAERAELHEKWHKNDAYNICFVNDEGTRYFSATRICLEWNDNKGNHMWFGGGTRWNVSYGMIQWKCWRLTDPFGGHYKEYTWECGKRYAKSANGTEIPSQVATKKEVLAIAKAIGIFEL